MRGDVAVLRSRYGSYCGIKCRSCQPSTPPLPSDCHQARDAAMHAPGKRYIIIAVSQSATREKVRQLGPSEFPDSAAVLEQLERILATPLFQHSKRYPAFLRHVVEQTVQGAGDGLKERTLGIAVFRRAPEYDTSADPVVRNTASEVRKRLEEYYSEPGHEGELRIALPTGAYVPEFRNASGNDDRVPA